MTRQHRALIVLAVAISAAGCATTHSTSAQYQRDGVQYGVTDGTFRGRWWNYYERGRSFSDGGFWTEAEADFRVAVSSRSRDQLWPRTYGLHFVPEYFPHRELGIALYHQDRMDEAVAELEISIGQTYTARAAYFLDLARKALVERAGADTAPPRIDLQAPAESTADFSIEVHGSVSDDTFVARLTVDGKEVPLRMSAKEVAIPGPILVEPLLLSLKPGQNAFEVIAEDLTGKQSRQTISVIADVDGPAISFDDPVSVPGVVRGIAFDPAGVQTFSIAGNDVPLAPGPNGANTFSANVSPPDPPGPILYESTDSHGNVTRGRVPVQAVVLSSRLTDAVLASNRTRVASWPGGIRVLEFSGVPVAAVADPAQTDRPMLRFANLHDGQQYLMDEIVVALDVNAEGPVTETQLNGVPLEPAPDRTIQHLSRRIKLEPGANPVEAIARDARGNEASASVTVERRLTQIEQRLNHLNVALLGLVPEGNAPVVDGEAQVILDSLTLQLSGHNRFSLVDRQLLPEVIEEQQLSAALSSREGRLALGQVIPAEIMLAGRVHRDTDSLEIVVEAISTESSLFVARCDVAGRADNLTELDALVDELALRIVQAFPRAQGEVVRVRGEQSAPLKPTLAILRTDLAGDERAWTIDELERTLLQSDRFRFVSRDRLREIEQELQLSAAVGDEERRLAIGQVVPADYLIDTRIERLNGSATAIVEVVNTATSESIVRHEVAADGAGEDAFRRAGLHLANTLAADIPEGSRFAENTGNAPRITANLSRQQGVEESMKYVVFRYGPDIVDPMTKEVLGRETEILGEGLVQSVNDASSVAGMLGTHPIGNLQVGDYVATK